MLRTAIGRFSLLSLIEGLSLLVLIFVAVPVKYFFLHDSLVKVMGPIHGGLFLLYIVFAITTSVEYKWNIKTVIILFVASVIPFGNFYCEHKIIRPQMKRLKTDHTSKAEKEVFKQDRKFYFWLKRIGITGFLFFLIKGLIWIGIFAGLFKGCS